jgi:anti-sigma regulatory factor (Ser/Thr protein kinase)
MQLNLDRDVTELARIVSATRAYFCEAHIPDRLAPAVDLATEELFVNIVRHGGNGNGKIRLQMEATGDGVAVTLIDPGGVPFDPREAPPVDITAPLERREPGGLGIHLVKQLVSDLDYEYRDNTGTIRFRVKDRGRDV